MIRQKLTTVLKITLIFLYLGYYGGITLFTHIHHVGAVTVAHSHPFSGDASSPNHTHTEAQFQTIQELTHPQLQAVALFLLPVVCVILLYIVQPAVSIGLLRHQVSGCALRAPPVIR